MSAGMRSKNNWFVEAYAAVVIGLLTVAALVTAVGIIKFVWQRLP